MFDEANTVEQMVIDACVSNGWTYAAGPSLSRQAADVFVESSLRQALIKLNPEVAEQPDRADEVIYKLRAVPGAVEQLSKSRFPTSQRIASMPTQASDLFVDGDNQLYLLDDSFVLELSPSALVGEAFQEATTSQTQEVESDWIDTALVESDPFWTADEHELQLLEVA